MKSGTSYIQSRLFANRDALLDAGVLIPSPSWGSHVAAVRDVLRDELERGRWGKLVNRVREHDGTSLISMEFLGPARAASVQRVVDSFEGLDVSVIVTARDLNRQIPAMWQETVQNGRSWTFADYLEGVRIRRPGHNQDSPASEAGRTFWRQQNLVPFTRTWGGAVGMDNFHIVTVPAPGAPSELLWERFCSLVGLDPAGFAPAERANESIGAASVLAVRRLNELLDEAGLQFPVGEKLRKGNLAKEVLAEHRKAEPKIGFPIPEWVPDSSRRMVAGLKESGARIVGDWSDLDPVAVPGARPDEVGDAAVAEAAIVGLAGIMEQLIRADLEARAED